MASVLSSDGKQDPDVLAANATSAALMLSDIPWGGPIGMIRIGRICGQFIVNPTMDEVILNISEYISYWQVGREHPLLHSAFLLFCPITRSFVCFACVISIVKLKFLYVCVKSFKIY